MFARFGAQKGELDVRFLQPSFVAGEVVHGIVHLTVYEPIIAESLFLKFLGVEKVKWTEKATSRRNQPASEQAQHPRFRQVLGLFTTPEVLHEGEYTYPFTVELPSALPGVFTMKTYSSDSIGKLGAMIRYTVEAILEIPGENEVGIYCKDIIVIHEKVTGKPRVRQEATEQLVRFSLFTKGLCHVSVSIARDVYYPGQTVHVKWEMASASGTSAIVVKELHTRLIQVLNVTLGFETKRTFSRYLTKTDSKGLPAAKSIVHYQPLVLVSKSEGFVSPTTTTGANLQCRYLLEMECKLDGSSENLIMRLPIKMVGAGVHCAGLVVTDSLSDDGLAVALRSSTMTSR